ncbi:hypothetical protein HK100_007773, partial [Physocladia obscura]
MSQNAGNPTGFETARLIVRCAEEADADAYKALFAARGITVADPLGLIALRKEAFAARTEFAFVAIIKDSNKFIGSIIIDNVNEDGAVSEGELGYWLLGPFQRHGYMTEALEGLNEYATSTLRLKRLYGK